MMPGSWEIRQGRQVLVSIIHVENTTLAWAFGLRNLIIPGGIFAPTGMPYDHSRNTCCQVALDNKMEWLFFLDSDVIPPRDAILRLMAHKQPIISGVYCRRSDPHGIPVMLRGGQWLTNEGVCGKVIDVDLVGAGCLLIHRTALETIRDKGPLDPKRGKTWFDWRVDMKHLLPEGKAMSEDFMFCMRAKELGYKILVDTSVRCKHVGLAEADFMSLKPLNHNPNT
jgi:hypothetical protein